MLRLYPVANTLGVPRAARCHGKLHGTAQIDVEDCRNKHPILLANNSKAPVVLNTGPTIRAPTSSRAMVSMVAVRY